VYRQRLGEALDVTGLDQIGQFSVVFDNPLHLRVVALHRRASHSELTVAKRVVERREDGVASRLDEDAVERSVFLGEGINVAGGGMRDVALDTGTQFPYDARAVGAS
jgi:hypothetical protein